jgi:hypothetical protein
MSFWSKYFGRNQQRSPENEDTELRAKCDETLNSEALDWARPYLEARSQLDEAARKRENSRQREKRILSAQQARKERRAPMFEIMAIPEDERSESENEAVKGHFDLLKRYQEMRAERSNRPGPDQL